MKSAFVVADHVSTAALAASLSRELVLVGGRSLGEGGAGYIDNQGRKLLIYPDPFSIEEYMSQDDLVIGSGTTKPTLHLAGSCLIECRSEELLSQIVDVITKPLPFACWVIDEEAVVWDPADIDTKRIWL